MTRKRLATFGERGNLVRLILETRKDGVKRYLVQWGPKGARQQESWPATKEGKVEAEAFVKAFVEESTTKPDIREPLTNRELWDAYTTAEFEHLRANTRRLYHDAWRTWEQFATPTAIAEATSIETIHAFRKALDGRKLATATVQDVIRNVRIVFNWGERMELVSRNRWHLFVYKVAKEKRTKQRAEYRSEEFLKLWASLNPELRGQWRAWVAVGLLGIYGNRPTEILNLRWSWIADDVVSIPPSVVKTGEEGTLRLFPLTRGILDVARGWRTVEGYTGDYVLFPGQTVHQRTAERANPSARPHYSIQSLTDHIHAAERRAGIEVIRYRAAHAFRRGLVGDLAEETGDIMLALQAIRDRDIKMAQRYRARREDKVDAAVRKRAERLVPPDPESNPPNQHPPEGATKVQPSPIPAPTEAS
jgi:integrase